jgi:copper homeostasis protein (lipoprotein)
MLALLLGAVAGCGRGEGDAAPSGDAAAPAVATDDGEPFDLAWQGVLPCADCDGIRTRLRLWRDADGQGFELEETYLGAEGDNVFGTTGQWRREPAGEGAGDVYRLGPEGGAQAFALQPDGSLQLLGPGGEVPTDAVAYRLHRL